MIANVGDKFVIEIGQIFKDAGRTLYRVKGFNTLVFDEAGLLKLARLHDIDVPKPFTVGDEIIINGYYDFDTSAVVIEASEHDITFMTKYGVADVIYKEDFACVTKTGRHFGTINTLLADLREMNNGDK